jgi:16S rRNA (cytosine1407-C5)-methyltransferase
MTPLDIPPHLVALKRYADLTDLASLCEYSDRPLRKSLRVNLLKTSVEAMKEHAKKLDWTLTPVPWCAEAFFVDRPSLPRGELRPASRENHGEEDRPVYGPAIGRDLLHVLGHFYLQEAASMLPPSLLDAQPGERILDMSAAPGSKTTQLASRMQGRGLILANDVQEQRLWTLKSALHRLGVHNVLVTKKVGQWFSKHMTERFNRVLCDAPCTAEGTVRKDSDSLRYCSAENREKMARLQYQLLEAAIHTTVTHGRIVYSTCTLTPEENEGVVSQILERFAGQVEIVDPRTLPSVAGWDMTKAIEDSLRVQEHLKSVGPWPLALGTFPALRLWPQTYDTEGFFSAVLRKVAPTREVEPLDRVHFEERELPRSRVREVAAQMEKRFGASFLEEDDRLFERGEQLLLANSDVACFTLPVSDYSLGLPFGKRLTDGRVLMHHEFATLRGGRATDNVVEISDTELPELLAGKDLTCDPALHGQVMLKHAGIPIGHSLAKEGRLKNNIPRWVIQA